MWFIGVEVEQETSAPPPKKDPGSAPGQLYSLPFVACRLTPFRPSLSLFYGLPRLISKCEVNESLFFQIIAFSGEGKQVKHCDIAFLDWEL